MRAIDTNVLVRLLVKDDAKQLSQAQAAIKDGAWVSLLVLAEAVWVLKSNFGLARAKLAQGVEMLLAHESVTLEDVEVVARALNAYRANRRVDFTACLILEIARKAGHGPLMTFDRDLARLDGVERIAAKA